MPLITLSLKHGETLDGAQKNLETAVERVQSQFGFMVQKVEWALDRRQVRIDGTGFWVEMRVDVEHVHVTGDVPILGRLLGSPVATGLKQIVQRSFQKSISDKNSDVSRLLDRLVLKKLIVKRQCPDDKRAADVEISEEGLDLLKTIDTKTQGLDGILSNISESEAKQLSALLDKVRG